MSDSTFGDSRPLECAETERVLGTFLDGASLGELDYLAMEALREHRDSCVACQEALERARRLDAELARLGPLEPDPEVADRFVDEVFATIDAEAAAEAAAAEAAAVVGVGVGVDGVAPRSDRFAGGGAGSGRKGLVLAIACGALIGGILTWSVLFTGRPVGESEPTRSIADRSIADRPLDDGTLAGVDDVAEPGARPEEQIHDPDRPSSALPSDRSRRIEMRRHWRPGLSDRRAARLAEAVHSGVVPVARSIVRMLPEESSMSAERWLDGILDQAARSLSTERGFAVDRALLVLAVRENSSAASSVLSRRMPDLLKRSETDRVVRRLLLSTGAKRVDRFLFDWAEGSIERSDELAADLRSAGERDGRALLLLDLWQSLSGRAEFDDLAIADRWFAGLDRRSALELGEIIDRSGNAIERRRAALACAAIGDPAASEALIRLFAEPNRRLRAIAGYALGRLPSGGDRFLEHRLPRALLADRAAVLASRRDPVIQRVIDTLVLSDEERAFLVSGRFDPEQFEVATALFRSRSGALVGGF